jgi:hypothetical protein
MMQAIEKLWDGMRAEGFWECPAVNVRKYMHDVVEAAHHEQITAEHLIPQLKDSWRSLPELRKASDWQDVSRRHDSIVRICIEEYYATATGERP